jgi:hypothetical protein
MSCLLSQCFDVLFYCLVHFTADTVQYSTVLYCTVLYRTEYFFLVGHSLFNNNTTTSKITVILVYTHLKRQRHSSTISVVTESVVHRISFSTTTTVGRSTLIPIFRPASKSNQQSFSLPQKALLPPK